MQYNAHTKHLHLDAHKHCVHGAAGAWQPLRGHTGQLQQKQYHLVTVLADYSSSYSPFACHMMLATSILTLHKLSNILKPLCNSLHSPLNVMHSPNELTYLLRTQLQRGGRERVGPRSQCKPIESNRLPIEGERLGPQAQLNYCSR